MPKLWRLCAVGLVWAVALPVSAASEGSPSTGDEAVVEDAFQIQKYRDEVKEAFEKRRVSGVRVLLRRPATSALTMEAFEASQETLFKMAVASEILKDLFIWTSPRVDVRLKAVAVDPARIARMIDPVIRSAVPDYGDVESLLTDPQLRFRVGFELMQCTLKRSQEAETAASKLARKKAASEEKKGKPEGGADGEDKNNDK